MTEKKKHNHLSFFTVFLPHRLRLVLNCKHSLNPGQYIQSKLKGSKT